MSHNEGQANQEMEMDQRQRAVEPLQEPAEGPRPEQEDRYEKAQQDLAERPLEEPAEGDREDTGG